MPPATGIRKGSVLLIERDDAFRQAIAVRLRRAGFSVRSVGDAGAGLLARGRFDVTVGDSMVQDALRGHVRGTFALIRRPVDFEELADSVGAAARRTSHAIDLHALQRFVAGVPALRDALAAPAPSAYELLLCSEIRRAITELSGALQAAADEETNRTRAAVFLATALVAADLADGHVVPSRGGH